MELVCGYCTGLPPWKGQESLQDASKRKMATCRPRGGLVGYAGCCCLRSCFALALQLGFAAWHVGPVNNFGGSHVRLAGLLALSVALQVRSRSSKIRKANSCLEGGTLAPRLQRPILSHILRTWQGVLPLILPRASPVAGDTTRSRLRARHSDEG